MSQKQRISMLALASTLGVLLPSIFSVTPAIAQVTDVDLTVSPNATTTNSVNWVNVPGATLNIMVPGNRVILARYIAESVCSGIPAGGFCRVRILINGVEMDPVVGATFAFDSTDDGDEGISSWESHAVERKRYVPAGNYVVQVQYSVNVGGAAGVQFTVDDWSFVVEQLVP